MPKDLILYALFGGHFIGIADISGGIIVVAWQYSGQKLFFSGRKIYFCAILLPRCHGFFGRHLYKGISERGSKVVAWQQI